MDILRYNPNDEKSTHHCNVEIVVEHGKYGQDEYYYVHIANIIAFIKFIPTQYIAGLLDGCLRMTFGTMDEMFDVLDTYVEGE